MKNKIFNAAFIVVIVGVGLAAAYILFAVLDSEASGEFQGYSVTGALAGFVVVELLLFSTYRQLRKSDEEDLEEQINQLQQKLIRGAPRPPNFESEVAERERIVLARPQEWQPGAGVIFDFQLPRGELQNDYELTPQFRCSYAPISSKISPTKAKLLWWQKRNGVPRTSDYRKQFYENYQNQVLEEGKKNTFYESYSCEYVYIGGEPDPIESLKVITHEYVEVIPREPDPATKAKQPPRFRKVTKQRYEQLPKSQTEASESLVESILTKASRIGKWEASAIVATKPGKHSSQTSNAEHDELIPPSDTDSTDVAPNSRLTSGARVLHGLVICYHEDLRKVYYFDFWDTPSNFVKSSAKFNQILNSVRFLS
jgi:hypothetical protein